MTTGDFCDDRPTSQTLSDNLRLQLVRPTPSPRARINLDPRGPTALWVVRLVVHSEHRTNYGSRLHRHRNERPRDHKGLGTSLTKDFNLDRLEATRRFLNWKRSLENIRQGVAQLLITKVAPTRDRDLALMEIIHGEDMDSLLAIRVMAVGALVRNARQNPDVIPILQIVAFKDRADAVRKRAMAGLVSLGIYPDPPTSM